MEDSLIGHLVVQLPSAIDVHLIESVPQSLYFIPCERGVPDVPPQLRFQNLTLDHALSLSQDFNNPAKLSRDDNAHCESRAGCAAHHKCGNSLRCRIQIYVR